jgi:hypothetical protein
MDFDSSSSSDSDLEQTDSPKTLPAAAAARSAAIHVDAAIPTPAVPDWVQRTTRPGTSRTVGKFSTADDEFTRFAGRDLEEWDREQLLFSEVAPESQGQLHETAASFENVKLDYTSSCSSRSHRSYHSSDDDHQYGRSGEEFVAPLTVMEDDLIDQFRDEDRESNGDDENLPAVPVSDAGDCNSLLSSAVLLDESLHTQVFFLAAASATDPSDDHDRSEQSKENIEGIYYKVYLPPVSQATQFSAALRGSKRCYLAMTRAVGQLSELAQSPSPPALLIPHSVVIDDQARIVVALPAIADSCSLLDVVALGAAPLSDDTVRAIVASLLIQVLQLHANDVVHGNLTPGNIFLTSSGEVILADGAGLESCMALRQDLSYLSASQRRYLNDHAAKVRRAPRPTEAPEDEFSGQLFRLWASCMKYPYAAIPSDDIFAVSEIIGLLLNGAPSLHQQGLADLGVLLTDQDCDPQQWLSVPTVGNAVVDKHGAMQRGFADQFVYDAMALITLLRGKEAGKGAAVAEHPFWGGLLQHGDQQNGDLRVELVAAAALEGLSAKETVARCVGSAPQNMRLMRNWCFSVDVKKRKKNQLLARHGSGTSDMSDDMPLLPTVPVSYEHTQSWIAALQQGCVLQNLSASSSKAHSSRELALIIQGENLSLSLSAADVPRNVCALIIRDVTRSSIVVLAPFLVVVLTDVTESQVALGPCGSCLLRNVNDCPQVAVASHQLVVESASNLEVSFHGVDPPACPDPSCVNNLNIVPYGISYPGLGQHFAQLHLTEESSASLLEYPDHEDVVTTRRRPIELLQRTGVGHDYPYLSSIRSQSKHFRHVNCTDDVFLYTDDVRDFRLLVEGVHGGTEESPPLSPIAGGLSPASPGSEALVVKQQRFPVFLVLDLVEDCVIRDCSHMTIVVLCARNQIHLENVRDSKVVCAASYVVLSSCSGLEVYGYASKGALIEDSEMMNVFPLFIEAPCLDDISQAWGPIDPAANIFGTPRLQLERSNRVARDSPGIFVFTLDVPALGASSKILSSTKPTLRRVPLTPCSGARAQSSFGAAADANLPTVAFHHRNNISILRLPRTLCPLRSTPVTEPSCNLTIQSVHTGVIHIADAVGTVFISDCKGPLEIVLCAAQRVIVSNCENILVQVACFSFECQNSHFCHFALLCNNQPMFAGNNSRIQISALNITTSDFEALLERASVLPAVNLFSSPVVLGTNVNSDDALLHADRTLETIGDAWSFLTRAVSIVPPLQGVCVNAEEVPFLEFLEVLVAAEEEKRLPFSLLLTKAMSVLADMECGTPAETGCASLRRVEDEDLPAAPSVDRQSGLESPEKRSLLDRSSELRVQSDERPPRPGASLGFRAADGGPDGFDDEADDEEPQEDVIRGLNTSNEKDELVTRTAPLGGSSMRYADDSSSSSSSEAADQEQEEHGQHATGSSSDEGELEVCEDHHKTNANNNNNKNNKKEEEVIDRQEPVVSMEGPARSQGSPVPHGGAGSSPDSCSPSRSAERQFRQQTLGAHPLRAAVQWSSVAEGAAEADAKHAMSALPPPNDDEDVGSDVSAAKVRAALGFDDDDDDDNGADAARSALDHHQASKAMGFSYSRDFSATTSSTKRATLASSSYSASARTSRFFQPSEISTFRDDQEEAHWALSSDLGLRRSPAKTTAVEDNRSPKFADPRASLLSSGADEGEKKRDTNLHDSQLGPTKPQAHVNESYEDDFSDIGESASRKNDEAAHPQPTDGCPSITFEEAVAIDDTIGSSSAPLPATVECAVAEAQEKDEGDDDAAMMFRVVEAEAPQSLPSSSSSVQQVPAREPSVDAAAPPSRISLASILQTHSYGQHRDVSNVAAIVNATVTMAPQAISAVAERVLQQYGRIGAARAARVARLKEVERLEQRIETLLCAQKETH